MSQNQPFLNIHVDKNVQLETKHSSQNAQMMTTLSSTTEPTVINFPGVENGKDLRVRSGNWWNRVEGRRLGTGNWWESARIGDSEVLIGGK